MNEFVAGIRFECVSMLWESNDGIPKKIHENRHLSEFQNVVRFPIIPPDYDYFVSEDSSTYTKLNSNYHKNLNKIFRGTIFSCSHHNQPVN